MLDYIGQNKIAAKWLLEYPERRQAYIDRMSEFSTLSAMRYTGMPTGTDTGRPCENMGISLASLREQELWIITIEETESTLGEKKLAFLDARRWVEKQQRESDSNYEGRPGWVDGTVDRYADWFNRRFGCKSFPERRTAFKWWDDIINIAVRIAIISGAIK
jgi:hypothetical protein